VSRPGVLVTPEAAAFLRARAAWMQAGRNEALDAADDAALTAWHATGYRVDSAEADAGPLLAHGYRPEHGDPAVWAAEQIEEATATIRELRADLAALRALNATLLDALRSLGEVFSIRKWILSRLFR